MTRSTIRPDAALRHPLFWLALATLLLNDHVLKGAELLPGALTGKLSDVAGLVVAPIVLAALLRVKTRRGAGLSIAAVVVGFSAINLSPAVASVFESALSWRVWVDPTDLVALPAVALAWRLMGAPTPETRATNTAPRALTYALLVLGAFACMATSYEEPEAPGYEDTDSAESDEYPADGGVR